MVWVPTGSLQSNSRSGPWPPSSGVPTLRAVAGGNRRWKNRRWKLSQVEIIADGPTEPNKLGGGNNGYLCPLLATTAGQSGQPDERLSSHSPQQEMFFGCQWAVFMHRWFVSINARNILFFGSFFLTKHLNVKDFMQGGFVSCMIHKTSCFTAVLSHNTSVRFKEMFCDQLNIRCILWL